MSIVLFGNYMIVRMSMCRSIVCMGDNMLMLVNMCSNQSIHDNKGCSCKHYRKGRKKQRS